MTMTMTMTMMQEWVDMDQVDEITAAWKQS
jgi:hypothetical protein